MGSLKYIRGVCEKFFFSIPPPRDLKWNMGIALRIFLFLWEIKSLNSVSIVTVIFGTRNPVSPFLCFFLLSQLCCMHLSVVYYCDINQSSLTSTLDCNKVAGLAIREFVPLHPCMMLLSCSQNIDAFYRRRNKCVQVLQCTSQSQVPEMALQTTCGSSLMKQTCDKMVMKVEKWTSPFTKKTIIYVPILYLYCTSVRVINPNLTFMGHGLGYVKLYWTHTPLWWR